MSGIIFALGYSTYFFELAGIELSHAFDLGVGVTAIGVVGCTVAWSLMNSWGRRKLFILGLVGMTTVMLLMGILDVLPTAGARWAQALCTVVYALFYQATIGPLAFAILGETSTPMLRAKTIGLATACQALFGTIFNIMIAYMISPNTLCLKVRMCLRGGPSLLTLIIGQGGLRVWRTWCHRHHLVVAVCPGVERTELRRDRHHVPGSCQGETYGAIPDRCGGLTCSSPYLRSG